MHVIIAEGSVSVVKPGRGRKFGFSKEKSSCVSSL